MDTQQIGVKPLFVTLDILKTQKTVYRVYPTTRNEIGKKNGLLLADRFLHGRDQNNGNKPVIPKKYLRTLSVPILIDIPDGITELTHAAVEYHKRPFLKLRC